MIHTKADTSSGDSITSPLRHVAFRRICLAGLFSNLGALIRSVGAAWAMMQMTGSPDMVALVQTALALPFMLLAMPAGAIADMHDGRIVSLISLAIAFIGATALTALAWLDMLTPMLLLGLCFAVSTGAALLDPTWQSSIGEQVPPDALPAAVALNGISYNIARSIGPAVGGVIVATAGAVATFALNALLYLPLTIALLLWKPVARSSELPPETFSRAILSGVRYISKCPSSKAVLIRCIVTGAIGGAIIALMPLVARDFLHGNAQAYGLLLSAFGVGAVFGGLYVPQMHKRLSGEAAICACTLSMSGAIFAVALSHDLILTGIALIVAGSVWVMAWTQYSIAVQLSAPRWVVGRSLAAYQAAGSGGIAIGSWGWGNLAEIVGVEKALLLSAALMLVSPLLGLLLPMPQLGARPEEAELLEDPDAQLTLTGRSGPLLVEIEYRIAHENVQLFHDAMQAVRLFRQRNGAYGWSIARDIADSELWVERYHCPTWFDYLRHRNRATVSECALERQAAAFHIGPGPVRVRRMLESPLGSLRRVEDISDRYGSEVPLHRGPDRT